MMCTVCGCGGSAGMIHPGPDPHGQGHAHAHAPGLDPVRMVEIEENILGANDAYAAANRRFLEAHDVLALNLVSSPGAGKTALLARTIRDLGEALPITVIEGDQQTSRDADRIREAGARAVQINTGKGCHLDGHMVGHALETLAPPAGSVLFIENVGNLVCPAAFDLGERHRVVILSTTEGDDKPLKYPDLFASADLMLVNKIDLLPYVDFDVAACVANARRVNPDVEAITVSATRGDGLDAWYAWLQATRQRALAGD